MKNRAKILFLCIFINSAFVYGQEFKKRLSVFSIGYGYDNYDVRSSSLVNARLKEYNSEPGPFYIKYEYGITENIGIGVNFDYIKFHYTTTVCGNCPAPLTPPPPPGSIPFYYEITPSFLDWSLVALLNIHFAKVKNLDPYCSIGLGYKYRSFTIEEEYNYTESYHFPILEITAGARYYVLNPLGVYCEVGLAKSLVQGGLSLRF